MEGKRGEVSYSVQRLPSGISVVRAAGDLDGESHSRMHRLILDEVGREPLQLVLEVSGVTSVDAAAVEALISASALAGESDISLCLVASPTSPMVEALAAADLIERFEIFPTIDLALDHRSLSELRTVCDGDSPNN
jgi:anti-anti-sigma factor